MGASLAYRSAVGLALRTISGATPQATIFRIGCHYRSRPRMTPDQAINAMRSPRDMAIICIDVTNRCDLQCSNCTRLLAQQRRKWDMTPDNFRLALRSLGGFDGVIAMIGGNPCIHPQFPELCRIFAEEIPEQ